MRFAWMEKFQTFSLSESCAAQSRLNSSDNPNSERNFHAVASQISLPARSPRPNDRRVVRRGSGGGRDSNSRSGLQLLRAEDPARAGGPLLSMSLGQGDQTQ